MTAGASKAEPLETLQRVNAPALEISSFRGTIRGRYSTAPAGLLPPEAVHAFPLGSL